MLAGDLLLAIVAHQGGSAKTMNPPAGWTPVPNADWFQATNARIHAWYRLAGSAEPASYTFTLTGSGDDMSGGIVAVGRANALAPINASGGQVTSTRSRSVTAPSITTTVANTMLLFGGACQGFSTFTPPLGMFELWDAGTGGPFQVSSESAWQQLGAAGATGTRVATASSSSCKSVAVNIAVAP
jgi:hypothetical protein